MTKITPEKIAELRKLDQEATGAPWTAEGSGGINMSGLRDGYRVMHGPVCVCRTAVGAGPGPEQKRDDFALIAAARNALPDLLDEIEWLRADRSIRDAGADGRRIQRLKEENAKLFDELRRANDEIERLRMERDVADISGKHCPPNDPCVRCQADRGGAL